LVTLRCTASLLKRLHQPIEDGPPTGRLGDWYARPIFRKPRHVVLCTNERSLLCVVVPFAPMADLRRRFAEAAIGRIKEIPAPLALLGVEFDALRAVNFGRSVSRSVISTMNQFMYSAESWFEERPYGDLDELGLWLCDTPCTAISTHWPWLQAELVLTGAVAPGRRPLKSKMHIL
jgi:hypothetical protein